MTSDSQIGVNAYSIGSGTWIAHKPGGGDWVNFINPPGHDAPFGIDGAGAGNNYLTIRAQQETGTASMANFTLTTAGATNYQETFARTGSLLGSQPTTDTNGNTWTETSSNSVMTPNWWNQYGLATNNSGTLQSNPVNGVDGGILPVNGASGITLDGSQSFALSATFQNPTRGTVDLFLSASANGNDSSGSIELNLGSGSNAAAYGSSNGATVAQGNSVYDATKPITLELSYDAATGTLSFLVNGAPDSVYGGSSSVSVTAAQIQALRNVGFDFNYNATNGPAMGNPWTGHYSQGLMASWDGSSGFTQQYGYFDASIQTPGISTNTNQDDPNTWPSFWLLGSKTGPAGDSAEIDTTESYGNWGSGANQNPAGNPNYDQITVHDWNGSAGGQTTVFEPGMTTGFHTYGVDVEPTGITFYFDNKEIGTSPIFAAAEVPLYPLLDMALGGGSYNNPNGSGYNWNLTANPSDMKVRFVAVYASPNSPNYIAPPSGLTAGAVSASQINLTWSAPSGSVAGYDIFRGTAAGGEGSTPINSTPITGTSYSDTGLTADTAYYYTVKAVNPVGGMSLASNEAAATTQGSIALPSGWTDQDIGSPAVAGSATYNASTDTWNVSGGGSDIWNAADQFNFASENWTGDGTIAADISSQTNTNSWAKAGVMFRDSTAADAMFADVVVTPGSGVAFQWRNSTGGQCGSAQVAGIYTPVWVKLTRTAGSYSAFYSTDGTTWIQIGSSQAIAFANSINLVGIAVTSHYNMAASTASMSHVTIASPPIIIGTNFVSNGSNQGVAGTQIGLTTNLPGATWKQAGGWSWAGSPEVFATWMGGTPQNAIYMSNEQEGLAIALSGGAYTAPAQLAISAPLSVGIDGGTTSANGNVALGFWSAVPVAPSSGLNAGTANFTGISFNFAGATSTWSTTATANAALQIYNNGALVGTAVSVGTITVGNYYGLSYDVNTVTGDISNIVFNGNVINGLAGQGNGDFTAAATAFAGAVAGTGSRLTVKNFTVVDPPTIADSNFASPSLGARLAVYNPLATGWNFSGNAGIEVNGSALAAPAAPSGSQAAFLQGADAGRTHKNGKISQVLNFTAVGIYTLQFDLAGSTSMELGVYVDGALLGAYTPSSSSGWDTVSVELDITTLGRHTLALAALDSHGKEAVFVTNVQLS